MDPPEDGPWFPPPSPSGSRWVGRALVVALVAVLWILPFVVLTGLAASGESPMMLLPAALMLVLALAPALVWRDQRRREQEETHRDADPRRPCRRCGATRPSGGNGLTSPFWSERYDRCHRASLRFRGAVEAVPAGPLRDWLASLADDVDRELRDALQAARWGQDIDPDPRLDLIPVPAALRVRADRLDAAARELEDAAERAAAIAVSLAPEPDLTRVREQLDMLATQVPHLGPTPRDGCVTRGRAPGTRR